MLSKSRILTAALTLLVLMVSLASADDWKKKFNRNMASPDSSLRYEALRQLDVNDPAQLKKMLKVLRNRSDRVTDWHIRMGAVEALAKASDPKSTKTLLKELAKGKSLVKEAIATALGRKQDPTYLEALIGAGGDDSPAVRRAAIRALAQMKDKRAIDAILDQWVLEKPKESFRQWAVCKEVMEQITEKYLGGEPLDWKNWWEVNREKFSFEEEWEDEDQKKADLEKAEREGKKAKEHKSQTRNVNISFKVRGLGVPILVLPMGGYHEDYFQPYLQSIEAFCRVHYIRLPKISDFKGLERGAGGIVNYPIDKLVDAFEDLRKQFKYKKFAVMGHSITSTVAQRYVSKYPDSVSHLILVGAYSGADSYGKILGTMEAEGKKRGDLELEHRAQSLMYIQAQDSHKYEPKDADEREALGRKAWSLNFRNPHDFVLQKMFTEYRLKGGTGSFFPPGFDTFKEKRAKVPTLVCNGKHSLWTSVSDAKKISKHYPNSTMVIFENSTMMPFVEETGRFASVVYKFIKQTKGKG